MEIKQNKIYNVDCIEGLKDVADKSVDLVLTDIPYGECEGRKDGIRIINKGLADVVEFDLEELVKTLANKTKQTMYIFCGINQVSRIREKMMECELTTRLCIWEKPNPSPLAGEYMWLSNIECCVFGRYPNATFNEFCKGSVWHENCGGGSPNSPYTEASPAIQTSYYGKFQRG